MTCRIVTRVISEKHGITEKTFPFTADGARRAASVVEGMRSSKRAYGAELIVRCEDAKFKQRQVTLATCAAGTGCSAGSRAVPRKLAAKLSRQMPEMHESLAGAGRKRAKR